MMDLTEFFTPIRILITASALFGFFGLNRKKKINLILISLLFTSFISEVGVIILIILKINFTILYTLMFNIYFVLWFWIFFEINKSHKTKLLTLIFFNTFGLLNYFFFEKQNLNYSTFIIGTFIYVSLFIKKSFNNLKNENLVFFQSNNYIILFAPILFFLGFSFMFGYRNHELMVYNYFENITVYDLISSFSNVSYFLLLTLYIFKEMKIKNA